MLTTISTAYSNDIIVNDTLTRLELSPELDYLFDKQQVLNLKQVVIDDGTLAWQKGTQHKKELLRPAGLYWIKGKMTNPFNHPISVTLEVKPASINFLDLYLIDKSGKISTAYAHAGLSDAFNNRPAIHRHLINTITIAPHNTMTLIWRAEDAPMFKFSATAWNPKRFLNQDQHMQLIHGMLYGTILVMLLYNLFLYISTREKSYLYYVLYVACAGYLLAAEQGHIYYYLGTAQPWPKFAVYTVIYILNLLMFSQFCIHFLQLKQRSQRLKRIIRILSVTGAVALLTCAISDALVLVLISLLAVTSLYIAALVAGIYVRSKGVICAGHFVIAIMILVFSMVATDMAALGIISNTSLTHSLSAIGTTIMLIFFSLALADRINQLQKENREASTGIHKANNEKLKAMAELNASQVARIKLEQSASQAKEESRSKNNFLATLSHEIRTPMSGILGMTELLKLTSLDERQKHYLTTIEYTGQTLLSIIDDLQDYAKIEAGQMTSELASFNIEVLLDNCISTFAHKATEKNIHFITDLDPSIDPVLRGDATKLQQIIFNLLSNAFKFTKAGTIVLSVHASNRSAVNCVELKFAIQDSGIGLTKEEQQRLFSPFQHADKSTYGRYGGSGLGLAISKQLAELMDGHMGVNSVPGKGSCFWFTARLMIDTKPHPTLLKEKSSHLACQRLLLVDSNEQTADITKRLLISWKMDVQHAAGIEIAHSLLLTTQAEENPFSIILSEYQLADGNALTLAKNILESKQLSSSTFIVMATSKQIPQEKALSGTGIDLLLELPITFERLHCILKRAVTAPKEHQHVAEDKQHHQAAPLAVLLVEDNPVNQMVLTGLLSKLGINPSIAADGLQAVEMAETNSYDLIFMDCEMPAMDGYEATRLIRATEKKCQSPPVTIIALSAHTTEQHQQQVQLTGMNDFLVKPVTAEDLRNVIESVTHPPEQ